jgi:hypothetical protein
MACYRDSFTLLYISFLLYGRMKQSLFCNKSMMPVFSCGKVQALDNYHSAEEVASSGGLTVTQECAEPCFATSTTMETVSLPRNVTNADDV